MRLFASLALAAATLSACAQNPDTIVPLAVPSAAYAGQDCAEVRAQLARVQAQIPGLVAAQRRERANDDTTVGLAVLFFPIAGLAAAGGVDHASEIARLRGEEQTLVGLVASCG